MPQYSYVARNSTGEAIKGIHDADSSTKVYSMLKQKGYFPVEIKMESVQQQKMREIFKGQLGSKVGIKEMAIFVRQFSTIMKAGVPVVKCLDMLRKQTQNKKLAQVLDKVYEEIQKGVLLSDAMRKHNDVFSSLLINMVEAGEVSGSLDNCLDRMATQYEKDFKLRQKVKGALTYPAIMVFICLAAVMVLMTFVVPQFSQIFEGFGMKLPFMTQLLLNIGNFMKNYWYTVILGMAALIGGVMYYKSTPGGREYLDRLYLKIPFVSDLMKKVLAARFTRVSATMLSSGVSLIKTLEVAERVVSNIVAQRALRKVQEQATRGGGLSGPVAETGIFPIMVPQMISIGEESGALDKMLEKTAEFCEEEVDSTVSQLTTLMEPVILLFMAVVIGVIVISIIVPMFSISGGIK